MQEKHFTRLNNIISESLITSFCLDFIIKDQQCGDFDLIHNVRRIGIDV